MPQQEFFWFRNGAEPPDADIRLAYLDPTNPNGPYFGFIGNKRAVDKLIRIDFQALGRYNHQCNDLNVAFIGEAGTGKTDLARRHCDANGLPTVKIFPKATTTLQGMFVKIAEGLEEQDMQLVPQERERNYWLPPMNLVIDEVHALAPPIVAGLLTATEHTDGIFVTEKGITVDCKRVHWIIATTDRGKLFDAFDTRFTKVILNLYTKDEIAKIVQFANPDFDLPICRLVAHYCGRIPREALAFAREIKMERDMNADRPWTAIATKVADDNEIDQLGMTFKRVAILKALGQGPVSEKRLPIVAGCKTEELNKFIMPWLMALTEDQQPMVTVGHKGYTITEAGIAELDVRNIPHKGKDTLLAA